LRELVRKVDCAALEEDGSERTADGPSDDPDELWGGVIRDGDEPNTVSGYC
jgi:hypothetical protein